MPHSEPEPSVVLRPRLYLAGPMVFYPDPATIFAEMKRICSRYGLEGVAPLDNQLSLAGVLPGRALVRRIVAADLELMRDLDAGIFCLDGFRRGPEMDPGTAFEIGYMHALGKPLVGWTADPRDYPARVAGYFRDVFQTTLWPAPPGALGATSGSLRDPDGILVHSESCYQNAMTEIGIELSGGLVFADRDWNRAFAAAVRHLAGRQHGSG
ncbi:MAG TPA: nucleoside 2-deoxyribosyltransferase [Acetobacteraceae bacterium]|nr:nucleoside 2-deoxyribosyltransferase [Acetobacteraceae bacterium]